MIKLPKTKNKTIAVDIDGVLIDSVKYFIDNIYMDFNVKIDKNELTENTYNDYITEKQMEFILYKLHDSNSVKDLQMIPKAASTIKKLAKDFNIKLVTNRPQSSEKSTNVWLSKHKIYYTEIAFTNDKSKHIKDCIALIEDSNRNIRLCLLENIECIVFDYNYNRGMDHKLIHRVNNWDEAYKEIMKLNTKIHVF